MDKKKLAMMFNVDDDDAPPFQQKQLDEYKLAHYSQGVVRKSKREKEKEAAEAKKREEEEQAAQAYADFIDAFDSEGPRQKSRSGGGGFVRAGGEGSYKPSTGRSVFDEGSSKPSFKDRAPSPGPAKPKPKGQRAMDAFLEEIKRDQAERESRFKKYAGSHGSSVSAVAAYESQSGSRDRGDPATTNVFVANLPTNVDENSLGMFFARIGPVGSVKIMWPRSDPHHAPGSDISTSARRGMSGFVSYMTRADAEACVRELDGFDWGGSVLRVGWSKAVPIAARPMYDLGRRSRSRSKSPRRDKDKRRRSRSRSRDHRDRERERDYDRRKSLRRSRSRSRSRDRRRRHRSLSYSSRSRSRTPTPKDLSYLGITPTQEEFVRKVVDKVRRNGRAFQTLLETREKNNPSFEFLWDDKNPGHLLYKHLLDGVSLPPPPPVFDEDGPHSAYSTDSGEESERERIRKGTLGKLARKRFHVLLRGLSGKRGELARCMAFSLEHAESAAEVAEIIISSLLVDSTPVPRKIARLHLICDILHNSAASITNAWKFRHEFESRLGGVFDHLCAIYRSFPGRITAETFKKQVLSVVEVWEDWIVFSPEFTSELRRRLDGKDAGEEKKEEEMVERVEGKKVVSKFKAAAFGAVVEPVKEDLDGDKVENLDGEDIDGENIDGDNLDGNAMRSWVDIGLKSDTMADEQATNGVRTAVPPRPAQRPPQMRGGLARPMPMASRIPPSLQAKMAAMANRGQSSPAVPTSDVADLTSAFAQAGVSSAPPTPANRGRGTVMGGLAARRRGPPGTLSDIDPGLGPKPPSGIGGGPGGLAPGRPQLGPDPPKRPGQGGTPFANFSKIVDPSGVLRFGGGKAVIHAAGVDFSNGSSFKINMSEFRLDEELGRGNYGTVKKEIRLELDDAKLNAILMELDILHRAVAPEIVDFYGAFFIESCVYYCMEYMDAGSLDTLNGVGVPEDVLARITASMVRGLKFLKDHLQIMHRDVKPTNVLVNMKGAIKLCDFGVSGQLERSLAKTNIGCQSYMAPERIKGESLNNVGTYTVSSDVWSLGLSIIELAVGAYPYPPETYSNVFAQLTAIVHGPPPELPEGKYSSEAAEFVASCLVKEPTKRATYAELL
ncbi:hypothetical protein FRC11_010801, partial [Ceratobasidium sp. 423]